MSAKNIPKPDFLDDETWAGLVASRENPDLIRIGTRIHVERYLNTNGGEDTYITQGAPTVLIGARGRKSGEERISPANFMRDGADVIVVGSIAGLDRHPNWALNLEANPEAWVQIKERRWNVTARKISDQEREALWPRLVDFFPLWGHFQKYCEREFMVFVLSPRNESA